MSNCMQQTLLSLLRRGAFRAMAAGPVRASFSTAITPPWRTPVFPEGRPTDEQRGKVELGHRQLAFTLELVQTCLTCNVIFWIENPDNSWFWRQRGSLSWEAILADGRVGDCRVDQCRFGAPWRKRTRFRTNCHLRSQKLLCGRDHVRVKLRGRCRQGQLHQAGRKLS